MTDPSTDAPRVTRKLVQARLSDMAAGKHSKTADIAHRQMTDVRCVFFISIGFEMLHYLRFATSSALVVV
jgi:hypothetical protein